MDMKKIAAMKEGMGVKDKMKNAVKEKIKNKLKDKMKAKRC